MILILYFLPCVLVKRIDMHLCMSGFLCVSSSQALTCVCVCVCASAQVSEEHFLPALEEFFGSV